MSWARFDDLYDDTRKIKRAWRAHPRAVGLHAMAITYCSRHETDGRVDMDWLIDKLPVARERTAVLKALVEGGLFEVVDDEHFQVHDYLDYNPSRAELDERRRRDADRKARGRRTQSQRSPQDVRADTTRTPDGGDAESDGPGPARPDPSPPNPPTGGTASPNDLVPERPVSGRRRDLDRYEADMAAWAARHFPGVEPRQVSGVASHLRLNGEPLTAGELRRRASQHPMLAAQLGLGSEAA